MGINVDYENAKKEILKKIEKEDNKKVVFQMFLSANQFRNDKEVVLAVIKKGMGLLLHVSEELQKDKEVVLAAVKQNWMAVKYAGEELINNESFLAILKKRLDTQTELYNDSEKSISTDDYNSGDNSGIGTM